MLLEILRDADASQNHNWGKFFVNGKYWGETLEDKDRDLEDGGEKIYGDTCIPRGRYKVTLTMSRRWGKLMPLVHDVEGFEAIRIHGGNTEHDTLGCPLLGQVRTLTGVAKCAAINERLVMALQAAEQRDEDVWLEVK